MLYSLGFLLTTPLLYKYGLSNTHLITIHEWLKSVELILRFRTATVDVIAQFGFLPVLFWSHDLCLFITVFVKELRYLLITTVLFFLVGYTLFIQGYKEPYDFSRIMFLGAFYMLGYSFYHKKDLFLSRKWLFVILAMPFLLSATFPNLVFSSPMLYIIVAIAGIAISYKGAVLLLMINKWKLIAYIGKNTMSIYIFHCLIMKMTEYLLSVLGLLDFTQGWNGNMPLSNYWWVYSLMGVALPIFCCYVKSLITLK